MIGGGESRLSHIDPAAAALAAHKPVLAAVVRDFIPAGAVRG
jgi:hypothetical protein